MEADWDDLKPKSSIGEVPIHTIVSFCFHGLTIYLYPKETDCHHIHLRDDAILALTPISVFDVPGQCHCRLADSSCYIYRQASFSVAVPSSGNNVQVPLRSRSGFPISIRPPASSIYHRPTPKKKKKNKQTTSMA